MLSSKIHAFKEITSEVAAEEEEVIEDIGGNSICNNVVLNPVNEFT